MSSNNHSVEENQDLTKIAIEKNPCGLCRVQGLTVCKGHGGGGGGGSSSGASKEGASGSTELVLAASNTINQVPTADINALLSQNGDWIRADVLESVFHFKNPDALLDFCLDMERGLIKFYGKNLLEEHSIQLDKFFSTIENELDVFKKELLATGSTPAIIDQIKLERESNSLTLKFPRPTFYDAFVKRLVEKNLLPVESIPQHGKTIDLAESIFTSEELASRKTTAPTPFDLNGPKPKALSELLG